MAGKRPSVLALLMIGCQLAAASAARAGTIGFRNDTKITVIVQGVGIVNNIVIQGRRHTLQPGAFYFERIVAGGTKIFVIVDARQPTRVLYKGPINFAGADLFFSIVGTEAKLKDKGKSSNSPGKGGTAVKDQPLASVDLVPTMAPAIAPMVTPVPMVPPLRRAVTPSKPR